MLEYIFIWLGFNVQKLYIWNIPTACLETQGISMDISEKVLPLIGSLRALVAGCCFL